MTIRRSNRLRQQGFTIIELMVATTVFSTILVLVTTVMISIGRLYYKGINQANVQGAVRTIASDVSQHLQFNDQDREVVAAKTVGGQSVQAYCIGTTRYSYVTGVMIGDVPKDADNISTSSQIFHHILWRDNVGSGDCLTPADLTATNPSDAPTVVNTVQGQDGAELIPDNSQLTEFSIEPNSSPYDIRVAIAFGDNDLLNLNGFDTTCRGGIGDQFCATARLNTAAVKRLTGN
jgi:prepilin-type N-terminal cleavage/methylation domain-containing protein